MGAFVAVALEALEDSGAPALREGLETGRLGLAWTGPGLPVPACCRPGGLFDLGTAEGRRADHLRDRLGRQARRYAAQGLDISARDAHWLAAHLRAGSLQLVDGETLAELKRQQLARMDARRI
jgi:hypothetical protein